MAKIRTKSDLQGRTAAFPIDISAAEGQSAARSPTAWGLGALVEVALQALESGAALVPVRVGGAAEGA